MAEYGVWLPIMTIAFTGGTIQQPPKPTSKGIACWGTRSTSQSSSMCPSQMGSARTLQGKDYATQINGQELSESLHGTSQSMVGIAIHIGECVAQDARMMCCRLCHGWQCYWWIVLYGHWKLKAKLNVSCMVWTWKPWNLTCMIQLLQWITTLIWTTWSIFGCEKEDQ